MSNLTEVEIFSCMRENLVLASEHCDQLAVDSLRGPIYQNLRDELELIEGCCKQAAQWREDMRWWPIGQLMGECHKRAGNWLRGYKIDGENVRLAIGELNQNFIELAKHLRSIIKLVDQTRHNRTGKVGMILPKPVHPFLREDRKHTVKLSAELRVSKGGILIPSGAGA
jgi:hypothetical protein